MTYKPTPACPHPGCLNWHSIQRALTQFILVRIFFTGWLAFGVYALIGAYNAAVSDQVQRAMERHTCRHWVTRRKWTIAAALADIAMLTVQYGLTWDLLLSPHTVVDNMPGLAFWIDASIFILLCICIGRLHDKATRHVDPVEEKENA